MSKQLADFASSLDAIVDDYSLRADQQCREAIRDSEDREKVMAAREALARHEVAEEIRDLLETHQTVTTKRRLRHANGRFAKCPRQPR